MVFGEAHKRSFAHGVFNGIAEVPQLRG